MALPLMPKATAVWLIENTTLSFDQIAEFCGLHSLEVQGIADGDVASGITGLDPIVAHQVSAAEIARCEADPKARLNMLESAEQFLNTKRKKHKGGRYTPIARRQDKPDAIAWILKNCPDFNEAQIVKLIGTTKTTIAAVREKSHWNSSNIKPRDPVLLGLCTQTELDNALFLATGTRKTAASASSEEEGAA